MILVDTSVWIDHFRKGEEQLITLLHNNQVCTHPMVIGELACGHIVNRRLILELLNELPTAVIAKHNEVMRLIDNKLLFGKGIGWIDAHLLTSSLLTPNCQLWTKDKRLQNAIDRQ